MGVARCLLWVGRGCALLAVACLRFVGGFKVRCLLPVIVLFVACCLLFGACCFLIAMCCLLCLLLFVDC